MPWPARRRSAAWAPNATTPGTGIISPRSWQHRSSPLVLLAIPRLNPHLRCRARAGGGLPRDPVLPAGPLGQDGGQRGPVPALYFLVFAAFNLAFPGYVAAVWNLRTLSGVLLAGVPLEELMFAFTFGLYW